nr:hypothetical protein [Candidatus Sigynarchaeota archaeon]
MAKQMRTNKPCKHAIPPLVSIFVLIVVLITIASIINEFLPVSIMIGFIGSSTILVASYMQYRHVTMPRVSVKQTKKGQAANYEEFFDMYSRQERIFKDRTFETHQDAGNDNGAVAIPEETIPKTTLSLFSEDVKEKLEDMMENGILEPDVYEEILGYLKILPPEQRLQFLNSNLFADFFLDGEHENDEP